MLEINIAGSQIRQVIETGKTYLEEKLTVVTAGRSASPPCQVQRVSLYTNCYSILG